MIGIFEINFSIYISKASQENVMNLISCERKKPLITIQVFQEIRRKNPGKIYIFVRLFEDHLKLDATKPCVAFLESFILFT